MNEYINFSDLKTEQGITGSGDDTLLKDKCTQASRIWDRLTRRRFFELMATHRFDFQEAYQLMLYDQDLLSLTTLTNGDGNPLITYYLYPLRFSPKRWIELDRSGGSIFTYATTPQRCIQVEGLWGYHADYDNAWASSGDTVQDDPLSSSATTLNVSDGTNFAVQQTIKVESEQQYITAIATNALTVTRGVNGTTAASHVQNKAITIWQPDPDIQHWILRLANWLYRQKDAPFETIALPELGTVTIPAAMPVDIAAAAKGYRRVRI